MLLTFSDDPSDYPAIAEAYKTNDTASPIWKYVEKGVDADLYMWSKGTHGVVGPDIEAAASEWIVKKLNIDLAPKK